MKRLLKKIVPAPVFELYYRSFAMLGSIVYRFPSRKLFVIAVTGTKGKSTTVELIRSILMEAGHNVAAASTIRFSIGAESEPNLFKMTMPGRLFLQKFLRRAVEAGCTHAVIEMTSEGARQFRHKGIELDALVFTNLQPEHIESHGSFEKYAEAKLSLAKHLESSRKRPRYIVANADDKYGEKFMDIDIEVKEPFSLRDAEPYNTDDSSVRFVWKRGELFTVPLPGVFNLRNILAALTLANAMGVPMKAAKRALEHQAPIAGRAERVPGPQPYLVVVDYAHTPDSLKALYETYHKDHRIIGVLGSTGGGRDTWKRAEMGKIADEYCDVAILTNEDPYDEDPQKIVSEIAKGFSKKKPHIILNRHAAIREALREAKQNDAVLITGKGTDPYIMGPKGTKEVWSDRRVAQEELAKLGYEGEGTRKKK
ncbi:MAG TPA: UDP-N-acetylmuramoyl-L-alanyl-D-glutamate--2,6-diaminopimelate ligase [Candidatus Paceibacterota bacterium]|nr:UDP-N-acetylmuramoyl-L-alanyl-D-glutamate--2,6-diaminopimelate ligase [Candidatus Paceibacterota bacterium]